MSFLDDGARSAVPFYLSFLVATAFLADCSGAEYRLVVRNRLSPPENLRRAPTENVSTEKAPTEQAAFEKLPIEDRTVLYLLLAPPVPEPEWSRAAEQQREQRETWPQDCRAWNDEGIYRLLLAKRGHQVREKALPLLDRARRLCPDNRFVEENYRAVFSFPQFDGAVGREAAP